MQKRLFDIGWSNGRKCQACHKEEGTEKYRLYHCPALHEVRRGDSGCFQEVGAKSESVKEGVAVAKKYVTHPLSESQWNRGRFRRKKWESENHKSWCMQVEGSKGHVATGASLLGTADKWRACSSIMMRIWGPCMRCVAHWKQNWKSMAPSRGRSRRHSFAFSRR